MSRTARRIADQVRRFGQAASIIACLSLASGTTLAASAEVAVELSRPIMEATVNNGRLTLRAEGAPLAEVLGAIGEAGGFDVVLRGALAEPVHQGFSDEPIEDAIRKLVGRHALIVIHAGPGEASLAEIRVRARGGAPVEDRETVGEGQEVAPEKEIDRAAQEEAYRQAVRDYIPPTRDDLLFALTEPDPADRVAAVPQVGMLAPGEAVAVLADVLAQDDDMTVRSRAVAALTRIEGPAARQLLRDRALEDEDSQLRAQALNGLATSGGERTVNVLARALRQDPEPGVRRAAIQALRRIGGNWARGYLERTAPRLDPGLRALAEQTLADW